MATAASIAFPPALSISTPALEASSWMLTTIAFCAWVGRIEAESVEIQTKEISRTTLNDFESALCMGSQQTAVSRKGHKPPILRCLRGRLSQDPNIEASPVAMGESTLKSLRHFKALASKSKNRFRYLRKGDWDEFSSVSSALSFRKVLRLYNRPAYLSHFIPSIML